MNTQCKDVTIHRLKISTGIFESANSMEKNFEIRENDRDFKVGDYLILQEWNGIEYTGRETTPREVTYILSSIYFYGLSTGYVALGLKE